MQSFVTGPDRERAQSLLEEGEELLWVGKPEAMGMGGLMRFCGVYPLVLFIALSCVILSPIVRDGTSACRVGIFLLPQVALCITPPQVRSRQMRRWLYVLTNRRAMMLLHNGMKAWPLAPGMVKSYTPGAKGSIVFAYRVFLSNRRWQQEEGFLYCREAKDAMQLLEKLLHGQALPPMGSPDDCAHMARVYRDARAKQLAASPGQAAGLVLALFLGLGGLFSAPCWWSCLALPVNLFALLFILCLCLIAAANLRTYKYGKKLLARSKQR